MCGFQHLVTKYIKSALDKRLRKHIHLCYDMKSGISTGRAKVTIRRAEPTTPYTTGIDTSQSTTFTIMLMS